MTTPTNNTNPKWIEISSRDELEAFYNLVLPPIRQAAYKCGYAIGVHGSMRRDLDLIAAPWIDAHTSKDTLAREVHLAACRMANDEYIWSTKPCGRTATAFPICWVSIKMTSMGHIDLTVMPDVGPIERELNAVKAILEHCRNVHEEAEKELAETKAELERVKKLFRIECDQQYIAGAQDERAKIARREYEK